MAERMIKLAQMDAGRVAGEIGDFIVQQVTRTGNTGGVIGLSGGVDSTTTAALAKRAFDSYNAKHGTQLELIGYILPSKTNSPEDEQLGVKVAQKLGIKYEVVSIEPVVQAFEATNPEALKTSYHKGNLMSRIRANILSTKSATERKAVLGTGNKDEDFGVGYYTLFGDGAVHMSPIGGLPKRLVTQMALYFGFDKIANREPTAGLENGQTDFGDLGYRYNAVELVLEGIKQGFSAEELQAHSQVRGLVEPQLKINKKLGSVEEVVDDILRRHYKIALPKSEIIHPPIAPVTLEYR